MNDDIRVDELRCNVDGGESLGIISTDEAMNKANELGLDLVLIAPGAKPPVAKIMDYGKYKYQEEKKLKRTSLPASGCAISRPLKNTRNFT